MHGTGYLEARRRHPGLLATAVAFHVGIVGVILSYHPEILPGRPDPIKLIKIPIDIPPPQRPKVAQPRGKANSDPKPQIDRPTILLPLDPVRPQWPDLPPLPPGDPISGGGNGGDTLVPVDPVVTPAGIDRRFAGDLQPPYPLALQRAEIEGNVTVRVHIGPDGRVMAVELVKADDPAFFASTRDWALRRWRFKPATRDGAPVASWITKTVRFEIAP
jgi:periplasmic protein TonB